MPFVNLKLVGKLTKEQKTKIARQFSDTLYGRNSLFKKKYAKCITRQRDSGNLGAVML